MYLSSILSQTSVGFLGARRHRTVEERVSAQTQARAHYDGLIRGLAMLGILAALICLGLASNALHAVPRASAALPIVQPG